VGRLLPRYLLHQQGVDLQQAIFSKTPSGKPFVEGCPVAFNISHDQSIVAMAYAISNEDNPVHIGIDTMKVTLPHGETFRSFIEVLHDQLTQEERSFLESQDDTTGIGSIFALWTVKEAYTKAIGMGLAFGFDRLEYRMEADNLLRIDGRPLQGWALNSFALNLSGSKYQFATARSETTRHGPVSQECPPVDFVTAQVVIDTLVGATDASKN